MPLRVHSAPPGAGGLDFAGNVGTYTRAGRRAGCRSLPWRDKRCPCARRAARCRWSGLSLHVGTPAPGGAPAAAAWYRRGTTLLLPAVVPCLRSVFPYDLVSFFIRCFKFGCRCVSEERWQSPAPVVADDGKLLPTTDADSARSQRRQQGASHLGCHLAVPIHPWALFAGAARGWLPGQCLYVDQAVDLRPAPARPSSSDQQGAPSALFDTSFQLQGALAHTIPVGSAAGGRGGVVSICCSVSIRELHQPRTKQGLADPARAGECAPRRRWTCDSDIQTTGAGQPSIFHAAGHPRTIPVDSAVGGRGGVVSAIYFRELQRPFLMGGIDAVQRAIVPAVAGPAAWRRCS